MHRRLTIRVRRAARRGRPALSDLAPPSNKTRPAGRPFRPSGRNRLARGRQQGNGRRPSQMRTGLRPDRVRTRARADKIRPAPTTRLKSRGFGQRQKAAPAPLIPLAKLGLRDETPPPPEVNEPAAPPGRVPGTSGPVPRGSDPVWAEWKNFRRAPRRHVLDLNRKRQGQPRKAQPREKVRQTRVVVPASSRR